MVTPQRETREPSKPMTAASAISPAMSPERRFALGIGLTNECNLSCRFCYRDPTRVDRLSLDQVRAVLDRLPVRSVNLGTGENGMHPDFKPMLDMLRAEPIKLTITSNGHSIATIDDADVRAFADVEFSIDYPAKDEQDAQRGPANWDLVMEGGRTFTHRRSLSWKPAGQRSQRAPCVRRAVRGQSPATRRDPRSPRPQPQRPGSPPHTAWSLAQDARRRSRHRPAP